MAIFITSPSEGFRNKSDPFYKLTYITKRAKYQMNSVWKGRMRRTLRSLNNFAGILKIETYPCNFLWRIKIFSISIRDILTGQGRMVIRLCQQKVSKKS